MQHLVADVLIGAPHELASQGYFDNCLPALEHWSDELTLSGSARCDKLKLFVLGNGRAGKTQLVRRLRGDMFDPCVPSTHGIQNCRLPLLPENIESGPLEAQVWDFGGQDIYLGTHSLFLDDRAIYVLVWTPETENEDEVQLGGMHFRNQPLSAWLAHVRALAGPRAPVLVVQTQCDKESQRRDAPVPAGHGFEWLQRSACSAATDGGMERLWPELRAAARLLHERHGEVLLPRSWVAVGEALRVAQAAGDKVMPRERFDALCQAHGVRAIATTLRYLHQSGEVFSLPGVFGGDVVLDQAWALQGLYALLHREKVLPVLRQQRGIFTRELLALLLWDAEGHTEQEQNHFLSLMQRCGVCFDLGGGQYLAPECLPGKEAVVMREQMLWCDAVPACRLELHHAFLHDGMQRSLISALGAAAGLDAVYWRYGALFYDAHLRSVVRVSGAGPSAGHARHGVVVGLRRGGAGSGRVARRRLPGRVGDQADGTLEPRPGAGA